MSGTTKSKPGKEQASTAPRSGSWGPWLFLLSLAAVLAFFYWLLIYSGGSAA